MSKTYIIHIQTPEGSTAMPDVEEVCQFIQDFVGQDECRVDAWEVREDMNVIIRDARITIEDLNGPGIICIDK